MAVASLVLSLLGIGLLGLIFGHVAREQIRQTGEDGDGLAVVGIVLGYIEVVAILILVISALAAVNGSTSL
jgi:uncharacterized protein DUF4190